MRACVRACECRCDDGTSKSRSCVRIPFEHTHTHTHRFPHQLRVCAVIFMHFDWRVNVDNLNRHTHTHTHLVSSGAFCCANTRARSMGESFSDEFRVLLSNASHRARTIECRYPPPPPVAASSSSVLLSVRVSTAPPPRARFARIY